MRSFTARVARPVINVVWLVCAALVAIVLLGALPIYYSHLAQPIRADPYGLGQFNQPFQVLLGLSDLVSTLMSFALAALLFWRKPNDRMAPFVSFFFLYTSVAWSHSLDYFLTVYFGAPSTSPLWSNLSTPPTILLFSIFPNGRFVPRWTRWIVLVSIPAALAQAVARVQAISILAGDEASAIIGVVNYSLYMLVIYAQVYRYRRVSNYAERQQTKWVVFGMVVGLLLSLIASLIYKTLSAPLINILPLALTIAVLRYRLFDIDMIINRTLVYGTLSAGIIVTYVLFVGLLGTLLNTNVNLAAAIVTAALTALLFQPLRARFQSSINRVMFGTGDVPSPNREMEESHAASAVPSRRRWLALAHAAWLACAALASVILLAAVPLGYAPYVGRATLWYVAVLYFASAAVSFLVALVSILLSALLFRKRRDETMALFISFYLLSHAVFVAGPVEALNGFPTQIHSDLISQIGNFFFVLPILFLYLFPNGRFVPRWTRWAALVLLLIMPAMIFTDVNPYALTNPRLYLSLFAIACLVGAGIYAQIYRYRRAATPVERQQIKWVAFGVSFYLSLLIVSSIPYLILLSMPIAGALSTSALDPVGDAIWWLLMSTLPLSLAVAVMRYRLWDIDIIINRALVFGVLTAGVVAVYILLVGGLSALSQTSGNLFISLLATGLIAFLFQPLRERLQRGVNRLMYGERDDPYALIARLGQNLEATTAPHTILGTLVRTIAQALKLPYVGIETRGGDDAQLAAAYGEPPSIVGRVPLAYQAETVGYLLVAPRGPNEPFGPADMNLLRTIAQQAGMAVHALELTADLQRSRERLVVAREEERRRIRRDLHDGLGPALASLAMQADNARDWTHVDPDKTEAAFADITTKAQAALQDIRRLVYDLRPPALDELGLVGALRQNAANFPNGVHVEIDASEPLPALSAAVEVAAYRIAQESLNNVLRHSHARHCTVRISAQDDLELEISDDGVGLPPDVRAGVGLISMRERAVELGGSCTVESMQVGGTRMIARLPLSHHHFEHG